MRPAVLRGRWLCLWLWLLLGAALCTAFMGLEWYLADPLRVTARSVDLSPDDNVDYRYSLAAELVEIVRQLKRPGGQQSQRLALRLAQLAAQLDPRLALGDPQLLASSARPAPPRPDACGERYNGTQHGYPWYRTGFVPDPECGRGDLRPLPALLTALLLDPAAGGDLRPLAEAARGLRRLAPGLPLSLASAAPAAALQRFERQFPGARTFALDAEDTRRPGGAWNRLVASARTPYVLLARAVFRVDELARLERQIHVISSGGAVGVAGGAFRNESGFWKVGCYQSVIRNYLLTFTEGYRYSALDCMLCDHLEGPFVANTSAAMAVKFHKELDAAVVFEDWFLRLKQRGVLALGCPDVLYFRSGPVEGAAAEEAAAWLGLARQWQADRVQYPGRVSLAFSCRQLGLTCDARRWYRALLLPPCCLPQVRAALRALDSFSRLAGADYELEAGSLLGAVKLRSFMPWDRDGDITFKNSDFDTFYGNTSFFSERGFSLSSFNKKRGYFRLNTPDIILEMWGSDELSPLQLPPEVRHAPTRVKMLGLWLRGEWNPGLFVRNRYGPGYLRHAQHWNLLSMKDSWQLYRPGAWKACPKAQHHACLDQYPADGSEGLLPDPLCPAAA